MDEKWLSSEEARLGYPSIRWDHYDKNYRHAGFGTSGSERRVHGAKLEQVEDEVTELRLMAVHAHPDDESSKARPRWPGTSPRGPRSGGHPHRRRTGRHSQSGDGSRGSPRSNRRCPSRGDGQRGGHPRRRKHRWLGFIDSGLPEGDPLPPYPRAASRRYRWTNPSLNCEGDPEFRPHVMTTYGENGGYPTRSHPVPSGVRGRIQKRQPTAKLIPTPECRGR